MNYIAFAGITEIDNIYGATIKNLHMRVKLVDDISKLTTEFLKMADALIIITEKFKLFEGMSGTFEGLTNIIRLANGESLEDIANSNKKKGKKHVGEGYLISNSMEAVGDLILKAREKLSETNELTSL